MIKYHPGNRVRIIADLSGRNPESVGLKGTVVKAWGTDKYEVLTDEGEQWLAEESELVRIKRKGE